MQNINLYLPELQPHRQWLAAPAALMLCGGVSMVLIVISVIAQVSLNRYQQSVIALEQKALAAEQNIAKIQAKNLTGTTGKVDREIAALRQAIRRKSHIANVIGSKDLGNNQGYSERLLALSRLANAQVSLQEFRFSLGEKKVELRGQTTDSAQVANFVSELKQQPSFSDAAFAKLSLSENTSDQGIFDFAFGFNSLFNHQSQLGEYR